MSKEILLCYYDVSIKDRKVYNVIYNGKKLPKDKKSIPGLRSSSIGALPINKSVWIVSIDNKPMLDLLKNYLSVAHSILLDYVVASLDDIALQKIWSSYKFAFIQKVNKFLNKIKLNGQANDKVNNYLDKAIEQINGILLSFGLSDDDNDFERKQILAALTDIVKQVYPDFSFGGKVYVSN